MKVEKYILLNINSKITITKWKWIIFIPIPLVKTLGLFYHKFVKGRRVIILFKKCDSKGFLILMLSSSDSNLKMIYDSYKLFLDYINNLKVTEVETTIVNDRLSRKILNKFGWKYYKDNWYIGEKYKLKTFIK